MIAVRALVLVVVDQAWVLARWQHRPLDRLSVNVHEWRACDVSTDGLHGTCLHEHSFVVIVGAHIARAILVVLPASLVYSDGGLVRSSRATRHEVGAFTRRGNRQLRVQIVQVAVTFPVGIVRV